MRLYRRAGLLVILVCLIGLACPALAFPPKLTVVLADHLSYRDFASPTDSPLTTEMQRLALTALISPGLPDFRNGTPAENLYATLSAGDTVDQSNEFAGLLERQLAASGLDDWSKPAGVRIIRFGDAAAPGRKAALRSLLAVLTASRAGGAITRRPGWQYDTGWNVMLIGVAPVEGRDLGGRVYWNDLTPIALLGVGVWHPFEGEQATLTSNTTHTIGLIALRDVAPLILYDAGLPIPSSMTGHSPREEVLPSHAARDALLARMDTLSRTNAEAQHPFGWVYGLGGGAILLIAVACVLLPARLARAAPLMRFLVRFLLAVPLAQLIAPWLLLGSPGVYLLEMTATALLLAWAAGIAAPRNSLAPVLAITAAAIILDAFAGTPLVSRALLSGYWLSGIRFYGIGNEFMGLFLGAALLAPVIGRDALPQRSSGSAWQTALAFWFFIALVALAYPQFGAKAGGAVTACAVFIPAWWTLTLRRGASWRVWLVAVLVGFAIVFAFAALAHALGGRDTHIQDATAALHRGKLGYIAHVALRKAKMAARIALAPGTLTGEIGMGLLYLIWLRSSLRPRVAEFLSHQDLLRRALTAGMGGLLACVLFNDSGAAAMLLMGGILALSLLHEMLTEFICAYLPSTSAPSASASPSATSLSSAPTL